MSLYILPFDHRSMFLKNIFGWHYPITKSQQRLVESYKALIFQAFVMAREGYMKHTSGDELLFFIDEEFGGAIIREARKKHIPFSVALEKSGGVGFELAYGASYQDHLKQLKPPFAKALVHYQHGMGIMTRESIQQLKNAIDYCRKNQIATVIEIVLLPSKEMKSQDSLRAFDRFTRPRLTVHIIREITKAGITPTVWKLEPQPTQLAWKKVIRAVNQIPIVVLGAGKSLGETEEGFSLTAGFPELIGFAVGRTVFQDTLIRYRNKHMTRSQAVRAIAETFLHLISVWEREKAKHCKQTIKPVIRSRKLAKRH